MTDLGRLAHLLRNTPVREIIRALERDGFTLDRSGVTGARVYRHADARRAVIHYHHGGDTLTRKTLRSVLRSLTWTETDLKRLGLLLRNEKLLLDKLAKTKTKTNADFRAFLSAE